MDFEEFFETLGGLESGVEEAGSGEQALEEVAERQVGQHFDAQVERAGLRYSHTSEYGEVLRPFIFLQIGRYKELADLLLITSF